MSNVTPGPFAQRLPVKGSDMLLVLIISLGSVRLLAGLMIAAIAGRAGAAGRDDLLLLTVGLLLFQTLAVLGSIYALVIRKYGLSWADLGLRPVERRWYVRAAGIAILLLPVVALVNAAIPSLTDEPFQNPQLYAVAPNGFSWTNLIVMLAMAGVVAPFSEEVAFRGLLFPWLRDRWGFWPGAIVSSLAFSVLHGVPVLIPALVVIGVVLSFVYQRSGSLWPAIVAHGVFNGIMVIGLYAALAAGIELP
jgi:hypothetical protein